MNLSFTNGTTIIQATIDDLNWEYSTVQQSNPTSGERVLFGSTEQIVFELNDKNIRVKCISVSFDPLMKVFLQIGSNEETINKYSSSTSIIDIYPVNSNTHSEIALFVQKLCTNIDKKPWKIDHPRLQYSPILRYKIKLLWKYWLNQ